jgi:glutamine synthetase
MQLIWRVNSKWTYPFVPFPISYKIEELLYDKHQDNQAKTKRGEFQKDFFADLDGRIMSLPLNPDNIKSIISNGIGFDGSSIAGYATVDAGDRLLFPDPKSFRIVEFTVAKLGFFIGRIYNDQDSRAEADPRAVPGNILLEAETDYGFKFKVGPEHEFFILAEDESGAKVHSDNAGYFRPPPVSLLLRPFQLRTA